MKKITKTILAVCFMTMPLAASASVPSIFGTWAKVDFVFKKVNTTPTNGSVHRTPAREPEIFIDGNTLYFEDSCDGCTLQLLLPDSDVVVYSTVIPSGTTVLTLPYEGEYDLQIVCGDYYFVGSIVVE